MRPGIPQILWRPTPLPSKINKRFLDSTFGDGLITGARLLEHTEPCLDIVTFHFLWQLLISDLAQCLGARGLGDLVFSQMASDGESVEEVPLTNSVRQPAPWLQNTLCKVFPIDFKRQWYYNFILLFSEVSSPKLRSLICTGCYLAVICHQTERHHHGQPRQLHQLQLLGWPRRPLQHPILVLWPQLQVRTSC